MVQWRQRSGLKLKWCILPHFKFELFCYLVVLRNSYKDNIIRGDLRVKHKLAGISGLPCASKSIKYSYVRNKCTLVLRDVCLKRKHSKFLDRIQELFLLMQFIINKNAILNCKYKIFSYLMHCFHVSSKSCLKSIKFFLKNFYYQ